MAAGHGGQVLLSQTTRDLVGDDAACRDLGAYRLKDLPGLRHLYQLEVDGLPSRFPPLRTVGGRTTSLPMQPTPLIGREREIGDVGALLLRDHVRLVTLTGPGGVGKTSLALAVAAVPAKRFRDGAIFVDLSRVADPGMVAGAILEALGAPTTSGIAARDQLIATLSRQARLLVLDNFEHLVGAAAVVVDVLDACADVSVLATSRAPLGLRAEHRWIVRPLPVAARDADPHTVAHAPATTLFVVRAAARDPAFRLVDHATAVAAICERTAGLPLAIELAAARVATLSPAEIAERMAAGALDLPHDLRDTPDRHRSLRATLGWSYRLLTDAERAAFDRFAVFVGGATPTMGEAVTDAPPAVLEGLVSQSMLGRRNGILGAARLVMLEPIREFAADRLAHELETDVRRRHAIEFAMLAERGRDGIFGRDWAAWRDRLTDDLGNFRAALGWAIGVGERSLALRTAAALRKFWDVRGLRAEGCAWLIRALSIPGDADWRIEANAVLALSFYAGSGLTPAQAAEYAKRAAGMFRRGGDAAGEAESLLSLAAMVHSYDDPEPARALAARAASLTPDHVRLRLMRMHLEVGLATDFDGAARRARATIAEMRRTGIDLMHEAPVLGNCARVALSELRHADALPWIEESIEVARAAADLPGVAFGRADEGCAAIGIGDWTRATTAFTEALEICRALGFFELVPQCTLGLAAVAAQAGNLERAALLNGAALEGYARSHEDSTDPARRISEPLLESLRDTAPERWQSAARMGTRLNTQEIIETALAEHITGDPVTAVRGGR
jgi:predicted ATPase